VAVEIRLTEFDPYGETQRHELKLAQRGKLGALVSFIGTMRDFNEGAPVEAMILEYYSGMTEKHLLRISEEATARWDVLDTLIIHRVGNLVPCEAIVLVAVWASHRDPAFQACRYLIEELKTRAPFWKKEKIGTTYRWTKKNTHSD